jgi:2-polyprenyl-3-methyl-5-hydroxy-6-metoxy-1,4-benzoquinol methylase
MNIIDKFHNWRRKLRWNRQYKSGRWDNLKGEIEAVRYQKIIDFIKQYGNDKPSILDLGCGEGILCERMTKSEYSYFLGMDFSSVSIQTANTLNLEKADFVCADIHSFHPKQKFDVIVFNEVFYYIHETEKLKVLNRMLECLNDDGLIITSIYREGIGCWNYFDSLKQIAFENIVTDNEKTYWKVGVYKK